MDFVSLFRNRVFGIKVFLFDSPFFFNLVYLPSITQIWSHELVNVCLNLFKHQDHEKQGEQLLEVLFSKGNVCQWQEIVDAVKGEQRKCYRVIVLLFESVVPLIDEGYCSKLEDHAQNFHHKSISNENWIKERCNDWTLNQV